MKLSWVYAALAVAMTVVGLFLSNASVEANLAVMLIIAVLLCLSVLYFIHEQKEPRRNVAVLGGYRPADGVTDHESWMADSQRVRELSRAMRNEPDPDLHFKMKIERDNLARKLGI